MTEKTSIEEDTLEKCIKACADIGTGDSVHTACEKANLDFRKFYFLLNDLPDLAEKYARAREARSDVRFDRLDELMVRIESGTVRPEVGRVLLDAIKWQCGKEKPKKYGDNQQVNHSGTIQHEQLIIQRTPRAIENEPLTKALPIIDIDNVDK